MSIFDPVYIDKETDTKLKSLVLNRLDKDRFDQLSSHSPDQIWFIQDSELSGQPIVVDTRPVVLPTKLSDLSNDVGYCTSAYVTSRGYATESWVNNKNYATTTYVQSYVAENASKTAWRDWYTSEWNGLTFTAQEANSTIYMESRNSAPAITLEYSIDSGSTWNTFTVGSTTITLANIGDEAWFRAGQGGNLGLGSTTYQESYNRFILGGDLSLRGNLMSLLDPSMQTRTIPQAWAFNGLFYQQTALKDASQLDMGADVLTNECYRCLFQASGIRAAPALPSTSLATYCYDRTFKNCTSLIKGPYLPATTLANHCYDQLFYGCSNLNEIKIAYTGDFSTTYFNYWVNGVPGSGTFYYNGSSTSRGSSAIPSGWTITTF